MAREETSESLVERRLDHQSGEAHAFYRSLQDLHEPVRVGIEATGPIHWFERLPGAPGSAFLAGCRPYARGISSCLQMARTVPSLISRSRGVADPASGP